MTNVAREDDPAMRRMPFRFDPGISFGHIIAAIPSLVLVVWFLSGKITTVDNTQIEIKTFKTDIISDMTSFKVEMGRRMDQIQVIQNDQFKILRSDIANIPEFQANLKVVNQRLDRGEVRADVTNSRLDEIAGTAVQNKADIVGILRSLGAAQRIK